MAMASSKLKTWEAIKQARALQAESAKKGSLLKINTYLF